MTMTQQQTYARSGRPHLAVKRARIRFFASADDTSGTQGATPDREPVRIRHALSRAPAAFMKQQRQPEGE